MDGEKWLRRFGPSEEATHRVVCFPHAGGSATFYQPMARALAPAADVVAVQYPGRQDRRAEPMVERIDDLADAVVAAMGRNHDLPLTFFGHSMGAVVAYEVACRLRELAGFRLAHLFVSGRPSPGASRPGTVHLLDDQGLITEIESLGGTDAGLLRDPEIQNMILPAVRSDYRAIETYRAVPGKPLATPITALMGESDSHTTIAEVQDWASCTTASFDLVAFSGGHFFLVDHAPEILGMVRATFGGRQL
ncbi:thioesterase II family protein [Amycolatopsis sp. NPDC004368]